MCLRMFTLIRGQGLAEFAWGEPERARGSLAGSGMEHAGLSVFLIVALIKILAKKLSVPLLPFSMCKQERVLTAEIVSADV